MSLKLAGPRTDGFGPEVTEASPSAVHPYIPDDVNQGLIEGSAVDSTGETLPEEFGDLDCRGYGWGV